ncbi:DUF397 domain-containing protein [Nocardia amamiensis]|uniref:DUF397 domain-containing protein n=1 Tax=Nocardia amamiensis TaxID=404578 RepID=UPI00083690D0|nr:DUF397 domain-containing protein [Nocardia amamiensis]
MSSDMSEAVWFKSSYSGSQTDCVEVAWLDGGRVGVRDSKNPTGPALLFAPSEWNALTASVIDGAFVERATGDGSA